MENTGRTTVAGTLADIVRAQGPALLEMWLRNRAGQLGDVSGEETHRYGQLLLEDLAKIRADDWSDPSYNALKDHLADLSRAFALRRVTPSETATFIFALKDALRPLLRAPGSGPARAGETGEAIDRLIDQMGLHTFEIYTRSRENLIREQQRSILELSTPVVELWDRILALPLVGTVDTARTQQIMEDMLQKIVDTGAEVVLIDITGVPVVDTSVARHLLQTGTAARLLGAEVILVGISPRIAQTLVHLGVDLGDVTTRATLAKGLELALGHTRQRVVPL